MSNLHLTLDLLLAVARGKRNQGDVVAAISNHLFELCPRCRETFAEYLAVVAETGEPILTDPGEDQELARAAVAEDASSFERVKSAMRGRCGSLLSLPMAERLREVERDPRSYQGPALADLLLEESLRCLPNHSQDAFALARLARAVLRNTEPSPLAKVLYARATAHLGNALRAQGHLAEAAEALADARFLLREEGGGERLVQAEIDAFEGSLRRAERRFAEAIELLRRALMVYQLEERAEETAGTLLRLGMVHREQGNLEEALLATYQALQTLGDKGSESLRLMAVHNLAVLLNEGGQPADAREALEEHLALYQRFPDAWTQLRRLWLEGKIARRLGELESAELSLLAVRAGFLRQAIGYDAALVSLDLAGLYLDQGRTTDVKRLAEESAPIFGAQDVHREAMAALTLFQEAARLEQVSSGFLAELIAYLEAARVNPRLAFQSPETR